MIFATLQMILIPQIQHQFNGIIWRMEIDGLTDTLFTEIRNETEKQVSFASINLLSGNINFDQLTTGERWLTGMETAYDGVLLLHNYESAGSPAHKGLTAIDGKTGQTLWTDYNRTFDHLNTRGPVCFDNRVQPKKFIVLDIHTGVSIGAYAPAVDIDADMEIILPEMQNISDTSNEQLPETPFGNIIHQLDGNGYRIVSLHALKNDALSQQLFIFKDGEQVFSDMLNTGIQKLQPEAFVMYRHFLIYLVNRVELKVINLKN